MATPVLTISSDGKLISIFDDELIASEEGIQFNNLTENTDIWLNWGFGDLISQNKTYESIPVYNDAVIDIDTNGKLICFGKKLKYANNDYEGIYIPTEDYDIWIAEESSIVMLDLWTLDTTLTSLTIGG